ncbi:MAG: DUF2029 domain-containing protein [Actinobacteria bacterium]|nr:DUF2029 domain-containing protein [Actinomycetota bacterium]
MAGEPVSGRSRSAVRPAPAGAAEPALLDPATRPAGQTSLVVAAAVSFQAVAWALLIWLLRSGGPWYGFFDVSDIGVYLDYAQKVAAGLAVYRDFSFEYPPLALPLFTLPYRGDPAAYPTWFAAEMILLCTAAAALTGATAAAVWRGLARPLAACGAYAAAVLAAGAITANRYDVAVALTLAAALFFLARRHTTAAGAALGVGVALKLTPGLLLPLALIVAGTRRRALYALAGFLVFAAVPLLPFLGRWDGLTNVITYHAQRPLQIESVPGTPYLIAGSMGAWGIGTGSSFGSQSLAGPGSEVVARLSVWLGLLLVAGVYVLVWRRRELLRTVPEHIPAAALACVLAFTVANKVLSPQFLCWTFPLVALVLVGRGSLQRLTGILTLAAIAVTQVEFPGLYWRMVDLEPGPVYVVVVRNVVLVGAAVAAAVTVWKLPAAAAEA